MAWITGSSVVIVTALLLTSKSASFQTCSIGFSSQYEVTEGPDSQGHVLATFGNSSITNLTVSDSASGYLAVNVTTGQSAGSPTFILYIAKAIDLETLTRESLEGRVVCADQNNPNGYNPTSVLVLLIGENDYPPQFSNASYTQTVPEDLKPGSTVFNLGGRATDPDYKPETIWYKIINENSSFQMLGTEAIILQSPLDYERGPTTYILNISAQETKQPKTSFTTLTIMVTDADDQGPQFGNATYTLALAEGEYRGQIFSTDPALHARDGDTLNAEIRLQLDSTSNSLANKFTVLDNGSIQVNGNLQPGQINLNVRAYQTNRPSDRFAVASVTVTVYDINDHSPVMSSATYFGEVLEAAQNGTMVLTLTASDQDKGVNGSFQFYLNDSGVPFSVRTQDTVGLLLFNADLGSLDRETRAFYLLHVYAQENQTPERRSSNMSVVNVTVLDVNDNSPVFQAESYHFTVNETALSSTFIGQVTATDADSGDNGKVNYTITAAANAASTVNASNTFAVDAQSGSITLVRDLRQQDVGLAFLDVLAKDNAPLQFRRWQTAAVRVTILAVNQHRPVFTSDSYNFTTEETVQQGVSLGSLVATDLDNDPLTYRLINSNSDFRLEGIPPNLLVNGSLDLDVERAEQVRTFGVVVSDGLFESTASVTVSVKLVNEYPPEMSQAVYLVSVMENLTSGEAVLRINATDRDRGADGVVRIFSITSPPSGSQERGPFSVNTTTGILYVLCPSIPCLEYSIRQLYTLEVMATDGGSPPKSGRCTVLVSVSEVNNQAPVFSSSYLTASVLENSKSATTVLQLQARDADSPADSLVYHLTNVSPPGWLTLNGSYVLTNGSLDAETVRFVGATVVVSDGMLSSTAFLNVTVLDVNDNFPQIFMESNPVDIAENSPVGAHVVNVTAQDHDISQDGTFLFFFESPPSGKFAINSSTGEITVAAPFDRRLQKDYNMTISVSDNSAFPKKNSTTLHVVITDSNTAPKFVDAANSSVTTYTFNVSEDKSIGFVVGYVKAWDPDLGTSGQVHYSIENGNLQDPFRLDEKTGQLSLQQKIDYEQTPLYSLRVVARDNSYDPKNVTVTVIITVNDVVEAPQWPDSLPEIHLASNRQCPRDVQVNAQPQDILDTASRSTDSVVYSLLNHTDSFLIHNTSGLLQRNGTLKAGTYALGLRACSSLDLTICSDTVLTVIVADDNHIILCPPFFTVKVNESETEGHVVADMNSTKGDVNITYALKGSLPLPFRINNTTGVIRLAGKLDREEVSFYTLEVTAIDLPSAATTTGQVTVLVDDAPDTPPSFLLKRYDGQILEGALVGDPVLTRPAGLPLTLSAVDKDIDHTLTYSVVQSEDNSQGAFSVNPTTGAVTLQRAVDLENMTASWHGLYTLAVMVTDGYYTDNATVIIQVLNSNDNAPVFDRQLLVFNVSEAENPPFDVAILTAKDLDEGDTERLRYSLIGGAVPFTVSSVGVLQLVHRLDREVVPSYSFAVSVMDPGGWNGSAQVVINVLDANDAPYFENTTYVFYVTEENASLAFQQNLMAFDGDLGNNAVLSFAIQSGNKDGAFSISSVGHTGVLRVVRALDREKTPTVTLTITAVDGGQPPLTTSCSVEVRVVDVNDNRPVWARDSYRGVVSEGAANNTPVTMIPDLAVTDADEGQMGRAGVVFRLDPSFPAVPFRVEQGTGILLVALFNATDHLDREASASYTFMLTATDDQGRGLNRSTALTVTLSNVNDHPPAFSQSQYFFHVSEDTLPVSFIARLNATDRDNDATDGDSVVADGSTADGSAGWLRFYLFPPTGQGRFYLDPMTGELWVSGFLDRETEDHYVLALGVYDGLFWGNATANITVDDINDNSPHFSVSDPLTFSVPENQEPGVIYVFHVTDDDAGNNGIVTLSMNDTDAEIYLSLSPNGTLSTTQMLDKEKDDQQSFTFTVVARDGGYPTRMTSLHVRVEVEGVNEATPLVCHISHQQIPACGENINFTAYDGDSQGKFLAALTWRDSDEDEGGQATLSLEEDSMGLFLLNHTSSVGGSGTRVSLLTLARALNKTQLSGSGKLAQDSTYKAVVRAQDGGSRPRNSSVLLVMTVMDKSAITPIFRSSVYHFSVKENQPPSTEIGSVEATVQSSAQPIQYSLQSTSDFLINTMGNMSTARALDREKTSQLTQLVLAWGSSEPSETATAVVLVQVKDENDNSPRFSGTGHYLLEYPECIGNVDLFTFEVTDIDNAENGDVTLSLVNGSSYGGVFSLNASSGLLRLVQPLDRETKSYYLLYVEARDGGTPPKTSTARLELTVRDVNDNYPQFVETDYIAYVDENAPATTRVKKVSATDADAGLNGHVLYELVSDEDTPSPLSVPFFINELTGTIYTARGLHYSTEQTFNLTVLARDLGEPPMKTLGWVMVYVNDLSKVLPQVTLDPPTVALVLGTTAGTPVPVNVSGGFGVYNFSIVGGNEKGLFSVDTNSGQLTVTRELTATATYHLTIRAVNLNAPQYQSEGVLTVEVTTVEMDQDSYAAVVAENRQPPYQLLDINSNAEKASIRVIYTLRGDHIADVFYIIPGSGQLMCNRSLDRELRSEYILTVTVRLAHEASSTGRRRRALSNEVQVRVIVEDVNDNPPSFDVTSNLFGIPSSAMANYIVTTLQAKDPDSGSSAQIIYTATGGNTDVFYVTSDGKVTSQVSMVGQENGKQFRLTVTATDNQGMCGSSGTLCHRARIDLQIVVVPSSDRFGLVANITASAFLDQQNVYLSNLSNILNLTLQLDKVESHHSTPVDPSKCDIYFYAFDQAGKPVPFATVDARVQAQAEAIHALFRVKSVQLIPVTEPTTRMEVRTESVMGEAEIAIIVVAGLIFLVSIVAIIITIRAWKKQKEFEKREEAAVRARQKLEQDACELANKMQETSFVTDPEEPLELYRDVRVVTDVQECVMNLDNESMGVDTLTHEELCCTESMVLQALLEGQGNQHSSEVDSGTDNNSGSLSSAEECSDTGSRYRSTETMQEACELLENQSPAVTTSNHVSPAPALLSPVKIESVSTLDENPPSSIDAAILTANKEPLVGDASPESKSNKPHSEKDSTTSTSESSMDRDMMFTLQRDSTGKNVAAAEQDKEENTLPEEPIADYQKRVSFAIALEEDKENAKEETAPAESPDSGSPNPAKKVSNGSLSGRRLGETAAEILTQSGHNYLKATSNLLDSFSGRVKSSQQLALLNPGYQADDEVLDGWAEDYDIKANADDSSYMSTAL